MEGAQTVSVLLGTCLLPLEMNPCRLLILSVTAEVLSRVLEYSKAEQSNVKQTHSAALKLDALKRAFRWMLAGQSFIQDCQTS